MNYAERVIAELRERYADQPKFLQAATEVLETIEPALEAHPEFEEAALLERLVEPERTVMFRVPWTDDSGKVQVQPRLPRRVQLRARPLQGRSALQPHGQRGHAQVPRLRADLQEQPDHAAHGRRQGRFGLRSQGQVQPRDHGVLPVLHDRALPPYRPEHRRSRRRPGRGRPRDRLPVRSVQAPEERVERRAHGQGAVLRRLARPQRGDRVRTGVLRGRVPQVPGRLLRGQDGRGPRLGQRRDLRHPEGLAARRHGHRRLRHEGLGSRTPRASTTACSRTSTTRSAPATTRA